MLIPNNQYANESSWPVTPIFVVGSPRSGTSMIGYFISSSQHVADFGEYTAFYLTHKVARSQYHAVISPYKDEYLEELDRHAAQFAFAKTRELNLHYFADATPWNLRIVDHLADKFPQAIFVLTLRHYSGVIQSLTRSYQEGRAWAGADMAARARLWSEMYAHVAHLPEDRTVALSYDAICREPTETLNAFLARLSAVGLPFDDFDRASFKNSYATTSRRPTIAAAEEAAGEGFVFRSIPSFDAAQWTDEIQRQVEEHVRETDSLLGRMFPHHRRTPAGWPYGEAAPVVQQEEQPLPSAGGEVMNIVS